MDFFLLYEYTTTMPQQTTTNKPNSKSFNLTKMLKENWMILAIIIAIILAALFVKYT